MIPSLYWLSTVGRDRDNNEVEVTIHMSLESAVAHSIKFKCKEVFAVTMVKDAIPRLYNGGGGFIESEKLVWTNQNL